MILGEQPMTDINDRAQAGMGRYSHDVAFFRRPPGAKQDGSLETITVQNRRFSHVAIPGEHDPSVSFEKDNVTLLNVHKHHTLMFAKGRAPIA
jgi:hypothetical protein